MTDDVLRPDSAEAAAAWAARVRANREQVDRYREDGERPDFYAPMARQFAADPRRLDDAVLEALIALTEPGETWLDIGAGGGRYALPIALRVTSVIAIEPSPGMHDVIEQGMADYGIANVVLRKNRWPLAEPIFADRAFISNVGYDIEEIGDFLEAMEAAAPKRAAVLLNQPPTTFADSLWPAVHGVPRATLPSLPEFLVLLLARKRDFEVRFVDTVRQVYPEFDRVLPFARWQTWVTEGSEKDRRLVAALHENLIESSDGLIPVSKPSRVALVTW